MTAVQPTAADPSPFHAGEREIQARLGLRGTMEEWGRKIIRGYLPEKHREFYAELPFIVAAARDNAGQVWATLLAGGEGFIRSPDPHSLVLRAALPGSDPLAASLTAGAGIGLLGIEFDSRRRNRVNGVIAETGAGGIRFAVGQTFGNCPQYITERDWHAVEVDAGHAVGHTATALDAAAQDWIRSADTMFIASGYGDPAGGAAQHGMDASHRGGPRGFVRVVGDRRIVFPDYAGNNHFNTIGNLLLDPRVGLLFVDFERGSLLQVSGRATVDFDSPAIAAHPGARRLVTIDVERVVRQDSVLPIRWSAASAARRSLRVIGRRRESDDVVSLLLAAEEPGLADFSAGQHLPIELAVDGEGTRLGRTYSLSNAPGSGTYRISVKREAAGLASRFIHDKVAIGDRIVAASPAGDFVLEPGHRPIVLLGAGIGVTPLVSMLHELTESADGRRVHFLQSARDGRHRPFAAEVAALVERNPNASAHVFYSRPEPGDVVDGRSHREGRLTADAVRDLVPDLDADYYLCGPTPFMLGLESGLVALGVPATRLHNESF